MTKFEKKSQPKRGFASMSIERRTQIARMGGIAAHQKGTAHEWTPEEASIAGKKGGITAHRNRKRLSAPTPVTTPASFEDFEKQ